MFLHVCCIDVGCFLYVLFCIVVVWLLYGCDMCLYGLCMDCTLFVYNCCMVLRMRLCTMCVLFGYGCVRVFV